MFRTINDLKVVSTHASMVKTQVEQVLKAENDLLNEMNNKVNDNVVRVMTIGGKMAQEPLYPEGIITHKYRGSQQFLRVEYSTQIC